MQVDVFVLHAAPQPLDEDIVDPTPLAVHADRNAGRFQGCRPLLAGELRSFLHSELWPTVSG